MANITFNNLHDDAAITFAKMSNMMSDFDVHDYQPIINAVEIDWNGATLNAANPNTGGSYGPINDSAQLLELINTMQKEIYVLTAAVIALAQR